MATRQRFNALLCLVWLVSLGACTSTPMVPNTNPQSPWWLAGDHHIHSRYSVGWDREQTPPAPIIGGDAIYPTAMNALMAKHFGLSWMVTTDHGGPNHSKLNRDVAYLELQQSRKVVAEIVQFYGMELDTPGADHSSLIIPHSDTEVDVLYRLESEFDKYDLFPLDPGRDSQALMIEALKTMRSLDKPPIVIANHPSRSAAGYGEYGLYDPAEFRHWHDTAPEVAVGMAGAPGHQAIALSTSPRITDDKQRVRGGYGSAPTMGGFDQMTARLGGFWDSMLGEGRHWWITANSDSHRHFSEGGVDFWPGEYSKTYVLADKNHDSILTGLRTGKVFVTTGDLVSAVDVEVSNARQTASVGGGINTARGDELNITIRIRDPQGPNAGGYEPKVERVDLIVGDITGPGIDASNDHHSSTRIEHRFTAANWQRDGEYLSMSHRLSVEKPVYIRLRGTNTDELEPLPDPPAEDPWQDLWFYTNPVFVNVH